MFLITESIVVEHDADAYGLMVHGYVLFVKAALVSCGYHLDHLVEASDDQGNLRRKD